MNNRQWVQLWRLYLDNIARRRQYSLRDWGLEVGESTDRHLVSSGAIDEDARRRVARLVEAWRNSELAGMSAAESEAMGEEQKLFELGMEFLQAADKVRTSRFKALLVETELLENRLIEAASELAIRYLKQMTLDAKVGNETGTDSARVIALAEVIHDAKQRKAGLQ